MARPSRRADQIPASPIRRLTPYAREATARGVHVHQLNIGQPDIPTPRVMLDAYRGFDEAVLAYGPSEGLPALREAVSAYFHRVGDPLAAEEIFVTTGGSEALIFAFAAVADPGDNILVPEPYYANYAGFAALLGLEVRPIPTTAQDGFHLPAADVIEARVNARTKAIVIAHPGNPTGTVFTPEELGRLGAVVEQRDLFLISDEVYREFVYDGATFTSALSLPCAAERVIVTDSISKRFSACGARIGFVGAKNPALVDQFRRLGYARLCPATVAQHAALAGYRLPASYFEPIIAEYQKRRDVLVAGLNALDGVVTYKPEGAFYTVVTLPVADADAFCKWLLTDFSDDGETVMMAPASGFYATAGAGRHEARIAYVLGTDALERSVALLARALDLYGAR